MILSEVIERIRQEATGMSSQPISDRLLDSEVLIELILPRCIEIVATDATKDPYQMDALRQDHVLSVVSGVVSLPESIKEEYVEALNVTSISTGSFQEPASYRRSWVDYTLIKDSIGPVFTIRNRKMYYRPSNTTHGSFSGAVGINAITLPTLTSIGAEVSMKDNLLEKVITLAAQVVAGTIVLPGLDFNG